MFHLDVKILQVMFSLGQAPLSWPTSNMNKNSCCFSILDYALKAPNQFSPANLIRTRIYSLSADEIPDRLMFANSILTGRKRRNETNIYVIKWNNGRKLVLLIL